jgi:hypothetical protein
MHQPIRQPLQLQQQAATTTSTDQSHKKQYHQGALWHQEKTSCSRLGIG